MLLAPIEGSRFYGINIRDVKQTNYYSLKALRQSLRREEEELLLSDESDVKMPDWQSLIEQASDILQNQSKDLEICAWLVEGLVRQQGFVGLTEGMELLIGMVEQYGDVIYPLPDEDGESTRLMPIAGLNGINKPGTLISPINLSPLLTGQGFSINAWEIHQANKNKKDTAKGELSIESVIAKVNTLTIEEIEQQQQQLLNACDAVNRLDDLMTERYADAAPSMGELRKVLQDCQQVFRQITVEKLKQAENAAVDFNEEFSKEIDEMSVQSVGSTSANRRVALNAIHSALEYYQVSEPHSPIVYLLQRALRWSEMGLNDILDEVITHSDAQNDYKRILGLQKPKEEGMPMPPSDSHGDYTADSYSSEGNYPQDDYSGGGYPQDNYPQDDFLR